MKKLLSLFSSRKKEHYKAARRQSKVDAQQIPDVDFADYDEESGVVSFDKNGLGMSQLEEFHSSLDEISDIPLLKEGHVEHGYSLESVSSSEFCPRCNAPTQQHYANLIYATNVAPRDMFAPAGYFCTKCPTVIIDEEMLKKGIRGNFRFQGVVGVYYTDPEEPDLFSTWNGQKSLYYIDEDETLMGIGGIPRSASSTGSKNRKQRSTNRRKMQKQSRKKNRRKK